ncbi:MAG: PilZ domain-containing protein [Pseudomonadota bacterium]
MSDESEDKRRFTRVPFDINVRVSTSDVVVKAERVRDISLGGMYIVTEDPLPPGTQCMVEIDLVGPASLLKIQFEGETAHCDAHGMGVKFMKMDLDGLIHLKHIIGLRAGSPDQVNKEYFEELLRY